MNATLIALAIATAAPLASAAVTVDFADRPLPPDSYQNLDGGFVSNGTFFNNSTTDFGGGYTFSDGFTLSTKTDTTTPGFTNQYSAITGSGVGGSGTYAVAFPEAYIDLPSGLTPDSVRLTNTTYAALSMRDGDQFAKQFGGADGTDPDFFKVTFTGYSGEAASGSKTGASTFYLADFRGAGTASDYIVTNWSTLDLTSLGAARSIGLSFASSDVGDFGINTPTYVAIDDLVLVPEPTTLALLALPLLALRRRR